MIYRRTIQAFVALAAAALALPAAAADTFPSHPIRIVVGTPAGGATDVYARTIANNMSATLKTAVVVENVPGANGNISAANVLRAPADGYSIWMGTQSMTEINPSAFPHLSWKLDDFTPLIRGVLS